MKVLIVFGSVEAAFADVETNDGKRVVAEVGKAVVKKLATPEGREAFWRNVEIMTMRTDIEVGIDLDAPFGEALLPLGQRELFNALDAVELHSLQNLARQTLTWPAEETAPYRPGALFPREVDRCVSSPSGSGRGRGSHAHLSVDGAPQPRRGNSCV